MASKPTGRRRGRPAWRWQTWPHRYEIAVSDAFQALGMNERAATDLAVAFFHGQEIPPPDHRFTISYEIQNKPGAPATFKGRASTVRQKANRMPVEREFVEWRKMMASAVWLALRSGPDRNACRIEILARAKKADDLRGDAGSSRADQLFAQKVLLPLLKKLQRF